MQFNLAIILAKKNVRELSSYPFHSFHPPIAFVSKWRRKKHEKRKIFNFH